MKKLSKADIEARDVLITRLNDAFSELTNAVDEFNSTIQSQWTDVEEKQNAYNEVLAEAGEWAEGIRDQIDEYMGERSEKWQEGETASQYESWKGEYENAAQLAESELSAPDELNVDIDNHADTLGDLPEAIE